MAWGCDGRKRRRWTSGIINAWGARRIRHGKGDRERLAYPSAPIMAALEAWLTVRGRWEGPLFISMSHGERRLTTRGINMILRERALQQRGGGVALQSLPPPHA